MPVSPAETSVLTAIFDEDDDRYYGGRYINRTTYILLLEIGKTYRLLLCPPYKGANRAGLLVRL